MKKSIAILLGVFTFIQVHAQALTNEVVVEFGGTNGSFPCSLVLSGSLLYGAAEYGVSSSEPETGIGTIFVVNTNGSGFTNLVDFNVVTNGENPTSVILYSNMLYGVAADGGISNYGTIFSLEPNGSNFVVLRSFLDDTNGNGPQPNLLIVSNVLYGTTLVTSPNGGVADNSGTVWKMNANGSGFTNIYRFTDTQYSSGVGYTNTDGANPYAGVISSGNTLYGTTFYGGFYGNGAVFRVNMDGSGFTNLYSFSALNSRGRNLDGANPRAPLVLVGNTLFGTTTSGGTNTDGTVFGVSTGGTGFITLHNFTGGNDGSTPYGGLTVSGNTLYGTAEFGGAYQFGDVFSVNIENSGFTNIYSFTSLADGGRPLGQLVLDNNVIFGTASLGGTNEGGNQGVVLGLILPETSAPAPSLNIMFSSGNYVISWPVSAAGYSLQTSTSLNPINWTTVSTGISSNGSFYYYTNTPTGSAAYFRLEQ